MSELKLNAIRLNTVSLKAMPINSIGFKKKVSSSASGDVDENGYIIFADPEVARICAENWGDGTGITKEQAAAVTDLGSYFKGNTVIKTFDELGLFTGVKSLNGYASGNDRLGNFEECTSLERINLKNIESMRFGTFLGCSSLKEVNLPNLKGVLSSLSFRESGVSIVHSLGQITKIENGDTFWGGGAFFRCSSLVSVNLPDTLAYLGANTFNGANLSICNLPYTLETVGAQAFYGCTSLEIEDLSLPNLTSLGGSAFYGVKIKKISNLGSITTLNTGIGDASVLEEVVLPDTVSSIPERCFDGYSALKSIKMDGVTTMRGNAFYRATLLNEFVAPNLTTANGEYHLYKSGIWKLVAPKLTSTNSWLCAYTPNIRLVLLRDITTINARSFSDNSTYEAFVCLNPVPPTLAWNALESTNIERGTGSIYVPDASVEAYKTATNWVTYAALIFPISQLATDNPELYAEIEEHL